MNTNAPMKSDYLSMIVTHLNAPYGPVLKKETVKAALEAGSLSGLRCMPLERELLETLFVECAPSLIGRACYQIGVGLENAQALYVELRKEGHPVALKWEDAVREVVA